MMYMKVVSLGKTRSEGEDKGGGGEGEGEYERGGAKRRGETCIHYTKATSQAHLHVCTHAHTVTGYTLHMNTASVTYTLKGPLIDLPNWKVAWLGHTW